MNPIQQAIEACEWVQLVFTDDTMAQERDPELWMPKMGEALTSLRSLQKEVEGVELPEPAFKLYWRGDLAAYKVSKPNIGDTDIYTADQLRTAVAAALGRGAPGSAAWENSEGWESLAWELCADENGEESCNELIWEGGPIPEPWGERWLKYEDEAKRLIALVQKHVRPAAPSPEATQPAQAEAPSEREAPAKTVQRWMSMIDYAYQCRDDIRSSSGETPRSGELRLLADEMRAALAAQQAVQGEPVAAQHRFRHPQKGTPDWSEWQPCKVANRPAREIDSQGYEVEYRALGVIATPPAPGQVERDREDERGVANVASFDEFTEASDHCLLASEQDLRRQAKALHEFALPALRWAEAQMTKQRDDVSLLDWLDAKNKPFKMGWQVGVAPAGNVVVKSVIYPITEPVSIRSAIRAARSSEGGGAPA